MAFLVHMLFWGIPEFALLSHLTCYTDGEVWTSPLHFGFCSLDGDFRLRIISPFRNKKAATVFSITGKYVLLWKRQI